MTIELTRNDVDCFEPQQVLDWRQEQMDRLGVPEQVAMQLLEAHVDWHQVEYLVNKGCPYELLWRLLGPLEVT